MPALLTADLNAPPDAPETAAIGDVAVDTWAAAAPEAAGHTLSSGNPFAERTSWLLDQRIDYVMARPGLPHHTITVTQAFLAGEAVDGLHPSDHYAVVTDLDL